MPSDAVLSDAVDALASGDLSYTELVTLYTDLRTEFTTDAAETVCRRALLGVVGEILDYLDFVETELEPSLGISRRSERERILARLSEPRGANSTERMNRLIKQWESVERHSPDDLSGIVED